MAKNKKEIEEEATTAEIKKMPDMEPIVQPSKIDMFESTTIKYGGITITISDTDDEKKSLLFGRTSEEAILYCADILRNFVGAPSLEETLDTQEATRETLEVNYGWTNIEYQNFLKIWRRNLYLKKIGEENRTELNLREYNRAISFLDKRNEKDAGEVQVGDSSETPIEEMAAEEEETGI